MGMRSATGSPNLLWLAAAAQGLEAAGLLVVAAVNLSDLAGGQTDQKSSAVAFIGVDTLDRRSGLGERRLEPEARAVAGSAFAIHCTVHQRRQLASQEPGAVGGAWRLNTEN